ncbi:MAG: HEAT repeat domain-containing protein [Deltaproteobacteria bacterium]|nr:HEAT repeat domain-containing protein [Deltaproteobacteria bacterium]
MIVFAVLTSINLPELTAQDNRKVDELIKQLNSPDPKVRETAAWDLAFTQPLPEKSAYPLIQIFKNDNNPKVRIAAASALAYLKSTAQETIPLFMKTLKEETHDEVRASAAQALGYLGPVAKDAIPLLIITLNDKNKQVRKNAAYALGNMGALAQEAIPQLIEVLRDDDAFVRFNAAEALARMSRDVKTIIPLLVKKLEQGDRRYTLGIIKVIDNSDKQLGKPAVPELLKLLKDSDQNVRREAAGAIVRTGTTPQEALPPLIEALQHQDGGERSGALSSLAFFEGKKNSEAITPHLISALKDKDWRVILTAGITLSWRGKKDPKVVMPYLIEALAKSESAYVRKGVAEALGTMGAQAKDAVPALKKAEKDQDKNVRESATRAISSINSKLGK